MSFSSGDKVKSRVPIRGGWTTPDVPEGTSGVVLSSNWSGTSVRVHFTIDGMFSNTEVDLDVDPNLLEKRW